MTSPTPFLLSNSYDQELLYCANDLPIIFLLCNLKAKWCCNLHLWNNIIHKGSDVSLFLQLSLLPTLFTSYSAGCDILPVREGKKRCESFLFLCSLNDPNAQLSAEVAAIIGLSTSNMFSFADFCSYSTVGDPLIQQQSTSLGFLMQSFSFPHPWFIWLSHMWSTHSNCAVPAKCQASRVIITCLVHTPALSPRTDHPSQAISIFVVTNTSSVSCLDQRKPWHELSHGFWPLFAAAGCSPAKTLAIILWSWS